MVLGTGSTVDVVGQRIPFGSPVALGGAASDGVLSSGARADHAHDATLAYTTVSPAGSSQTLSMASKDVAAFDITLSAASCAITLSNFLAGKLGICILRFHQDATGSRAVTFTNTITYPSGTYAPVTPTPANSVWQWVVWTPDGGTTLYMDHGQPIRNRRVYISGALANGTATVPHRVKVDSRIVEVTPSVRVTPSGGTLLADLNRGAGNGAASSLYTTQANRPSVAAGSLTNGSVTLPDSTLLAPNDYLTVDMDAAFSATDFELIVKTVDAV
jgi:hypothetical protein